MSKKFIKSNSIAFNAINTVRNKISEDGLSVFLLQFLFSSFLILSLFLLTVFISVFSFNVLFGTEKSKTPDISYLNQVCQAKEEAYFNRTYSSTELQRCLKASSFEKSNADLNILAECEKISSSKYPYAPHHFGLQDAAFLAVTDDQCSAAGFDIKRN